VPHNASNITPYFLFVSVTRRHTISGDCWLSNYIWWRTQEERKRKRRSEKILKVGRF